MTLTANWLTFFSVFALIGAAGARLLFVQLEASDVGSEAWPEADALARRLGAVAAAALLLAAAFRLLAQAESFLDPGEYLSIGAVRAVLSTGWGRGWWWQVGSAVLALFTSLGAPWVALMGGMFVAATLPLTGHAVEAPAGPLVGVALHGAHTIAGGLWLGTLAVALLVWRRADPRDRSGRRHLRLARLVERFSPVALAGAAMLIVSGAAEAWWLVGSLSALRDTAYGRRLLLKLGMLVMLLAVGAYNWRVVRPTLGTRGASRRLLRTAGLELLLAVLILAVTASLVALPAGE